MIGQTLSHYEILAGLGSGGMGDVYRARDTRLGRDVAIKVLPPEFTEDPERLARFEREARTLASLSHPHIAQIHGLEVDGDQRYLVLELVEGETLAERLTRGAIGVDAALPIALQIARALEAAHERGIIHRDVKPANVMLTHEGDAKVLDFGIARTLEADAVGDGTDTRTLTTPPTRPGVLIGTPAFMSPEQLRGERADKRSDIWAFGATFWEMLTGARLFEGTTDSDTLAAVLQSSPDWGELPADTPLPIRRLLRRCLERDPRQRLHDIADVRLEIEEAIDEPDAASEEHAGQPTAIARALLWWRLSAALAVGALIVLGVGWMLTRTGTMQPRPPVRFAVDLPSGVTIRAFPFPVLAISPDGRWLVFVGKEGGVTRLFKRSLEQLDAVPIAGTEGGEYPFFSPDSRWVGFFADDKLKKVPVDGGPPHVLVDGAEWGAACGPDGEIIFVPSEVAGLWRVSAAGGAPEPVLKPDPRMDDWSLVFPELLPDGKAVLFTNSWGLTGHSSHVCLLDMETGFRTTLIENAYLARYVATGHLIFGQNGVVHVAPFDADRRELTGPAVPLPESIFVDSEMAVPHLACSAEGTLAFIAGDGDPRRGLVWVDLEGNETRLIGARRGFMYPRISPDGGRLAVAISEAGKTDIWVVNVATGARTRVTHEGVSCFPEWTPDGQRLSFFSIRGAGAECIEWARADGTGHSEMLVQEQAGEDFAPGTWSPDGKMMVYSKNVASAAAGDSGIWSVASDGDRESRRLFPTGSYTTGPTISPDGRWLAYMSPESGQPEIYVQPFPDGGERQQVSNNGGRKPVWSPDGRVIYYQNLTKEQIWAVPVSTAPRFEAGAARLLIDGQYAHGLWEMVPDIDIAPDGKSFVMIKPDPEWGRATEIRVVQNWFEELERLAPTK